MGLQIERESPRKDRARQEYRSAFAVSALGAIPLAIIIIALIMYDKIVPIYGGLNGYDYDPAYQYVLNGVGLIQGYLPGHVDHPGTPLQLTCSLTAYATWFLAKLLGQTSLEFNSSVLGHVEDYIRLISSLLLGLNAIAIFYLGARIFGAAGNLPIALLAPTGFLSLGSVMPRLLYLSAKPW